MRPSGSTFVHPWCLSIPPPPGPGVVFPEQTVVVVTSVKVDWEMPWNWIPKIEQKNRAKAWTVCFFGSFLPRRSGWRKNSKYASDSGLAVCSALAVRDNFPLPENPVLHFWHCIECGDGGSICFSQTPQTPGTLAQTHTHIDTPSPQLEIMFRSGGQLRQFERFIVEWLILIDL